MKTIIAIIILTLGLTLNADELSTLRTENARLKKEVATLKLELAKLKPKGNAQIVKLEKEYKNYISEYKKVAAQYKILNKTMTIGILSMRKRTKEYLDAKSKLATYNGQMIIIKNKARVCKDRLDAERSK